MKAVRLLLLGVGVLAILGLIALGAALNSSVQTWAARRALAARPDVRGTLGAVSAGFRRVELRDVRLEARGAVLTLPALEAEVPLWGAAVNRRVAVKLLVAKGWTLDLTHAPGLAKMVLPSLRPASPVTPALREFSLLASAYAADATATVPPGVFRGVFTQLQLPIELSLDGVDLEGEVILPALAGHAATRARVSLRGGGLAAGREGTFTVDIAGAKSDGSALTLHSTLAATMDTPRSFTRIGAKLDASVNGAQFPRGVKLNAELSAQRTATGESYALVLVGDAGQPLATLKAGLETSTARIAGTWKLDLRDSDVAPFALGLKLPAFTAVGEGTLETGTAFDEIHGAGRLAASAEGLSVLRPELAALGAIKLVAEFDVLQHSRSLRVERLDATVTGAAPVAKIRALQSFEFNVETGELRVADPTQDLVGLSLSGVPVAWAAPWLGDLALTGGDLRGEFAASARAGGLALHVKSPLVVPGLSLAKAGQPLLKNLDVRLNASADYSPQGWQAQVVDLTLRSGDVTLLSLDAKAGRLAGKDQSIKAAGHWSAHLPGWAAQPVLAGQLQLATGLAQGDFTASLDGIKAIEAKLELTNLVAATKEKLPAVTAAVRVDIAPAGRMTFKVPLLFDQAGRKSDLLLSGTATPGSPLTIDARLASELVVVEDVQLLALLVPAGSTPAETTAAKPGGPDAAPFWGAVGGQLTLALQKVVYRGDFEVSNVGGTLKLDPTALRFDGVRAAFGGQSDLKLAGGLQFAPNTAAPYALEADVALNNFDTAPAFHALDPTKPPTVEGRVTLTGHLVGSGANLGDVAERTRGDVQITGKSGLFRALSADLTNKVQRTQSTVAAIGGILGAVTGKKEYADYANKTEIVNDIAKALAEIPFDQLNVTATRDAGLNVVLKDFTLISPEVRLTGAGGIRYVEGTPLLGQPLDLQLNLGARGRLADLLKRAGLLEPKQDNLGYAMFATPIKIGGTLAKTDASDLGKALLNSALVKGGLLDPLLGK